MTTYAVRVMAHDRVPTPDEYRAGNDNDGEAHAFPAELGQTLALVDFDLEAMDARGQDYGVSVVVASGTPTYFALHEVREDAARSLGNLIAILRPARPTPIVINSNIQIPAAFIRTALVMHEAKYSPAGPEAFAELGAELELMRLPD